MTIETTRRAIGAIVFASLLTAEGSAADHRRTARRFGQVNRLRAKPGGGDALRDELGRMVTALPGADRYDVLRDERVADTFWTVEIWPSRDTHDRAVLAPDIQAAIARCRLIVMEFENIATFDL